ncbi:Nucleic acid-binding OB-fold [Penicillium angulare]|uniref:Nucleic acid-binding OB-fold n=1 Tax=Penicillium angulare TaxID=116970 RepID=A0A9W9JVV7_9EURO|nr:Nucleic acid-binding OB-fold [Penicillium angulare]
MDSGYGNNYNPYASQTGGGGFMAGETSSPSGGGKFGGGDNKTLRPVTVKQIIDATCPYPEAPFQVDGADVANVVFVAQVRNISKQSTNITYKVDDSTGDVEVKKWVDSATADTMDMDDPNGIHTKGYVRVLGAIKSFGNRRYIGAHSIRPVTEINEFLCSMLDAAAVHLFFTRGPSGDGAGVAASASGFSAMTDYGGPEAHNRALHNMSPFAKDIYQLLRTEPQDDTGLHMQTIGTKLGIPNMDVARAGEELLNAGVIFSTLDESTWAILDY